MTAPPFSPRALGATTSLSQDEVAVVKLVHAGRSNLAIAREVLKCESGVKKLLIAVFRKVGCRNRVELALWWERNGATSCTLKNPGRTTQ